MWSALSTRQRRVLAGLGLANLILLAAMGSLMLSPAADVFPPEKVAPSGDRSACRSTAALALADHGVAGAIAIHADGGIEFTLSGGDATEAWDALAVSLALPDQGCGPYDPIRIDLPDPSGAPKLRLVVEARWADAQAWSLGRIDDAALSERMRRSTYLSP
jgi:hypothetical protein